MINSIKKRKKYKQNKCNLNFICLGRYSATRFPIHLPMLFTISTEIAAHHRGPTLCCGKSTFFLPHSHSPYLAHSNFNAPDCRSEYHGKYTFINHLSSVALTSLGTARRFGFRVLLARDFPPPPGSGKFWPVQSIFFTLVNAFGCRWGDFRLFCYRQHCSVLLEVVFCTNRFHVFHLHRVPCFLSS